MAPNTAQARMGAHRSWANTADRTARTSHGTNAFLARFEREVDPDGVLPEHERQIRATHARKAYMTDLALRSARARRKSSIPVGSARPAGVVHAVDPAPVIDDQTSVDVRGGRDGGRGSASPSGGPPPSAQHTAA